MPSHSRSRDRYRGSDGGRSPDYSRRQRRESYDDDDDDDDFDYNPRERRRYRRDDYDHDSRIYEPRLYDDDLNEYDIAAEDPAAPLRPHGMEERSDRSRSRESPVASPRGVDRQGDGEGRRIYSGYGDDSNPIRESRGPTHRSQDDGAYRHMDRESRRQRRRERTRGPSIKHQSHDSTNSGSHLLGADVLEKMRSHYDEEEDLQRPQAEEQMRTESTRRRKQPIINDERQRLAPFPEEVPRGQSQGRIVSGAYLEEGKYPDMEVRQRGGGGPAMEARWRKEGDWNGSSGSSKTKPPFWKRKRLWICLAILIVIAAIVVPLVIIMPKKHNHHSKDPDSPSPTNYNEDSPYISSLKGLSHDSIPKSAQGSILDPWTWYDTRDFNLTFTNETVGGLPIMGLNSTWDDSTRANEHVPPLNESFPYGSQPIRGVNLGGWLSIEPFIVPSFFESYSSKDGIIDEYTLCKKLGSSAAAKIEKHYADFISEDDFRDMRDAGLDHVRIQYSYWAVEIYDDDPYVAKISWRYLLRAIEYCRKYGLRVKLDPHGIPGSQNGWNHSGREGAIGWLNGTDGLLNRRRSLEFHDKVSKFFAQPRYKNIVAIYGLVNEPLMLALPVEDVLNWTTDATKLVQDNGISAFVAVHDGFLNLSKWKKMLKTRPERMILDTHQYTIFNTGQIVLNHTARVELICNDWYHMIQEINTTSAGWGPTICGEWSQADTDCTKYLNNVGRGIRWEGTFNTADSTVYCPTADTGPACSCDSANAPPAEYSDGYKRFLQTYAEAQMSAFGTAQGWFYWTWYTESAAQWSYKTAWKNGFMPKKAYAPDFKCGDDIPSFGDLPEYY
ncbi:putative glucan 1,3-beta-glucosidase D [Aspergillus avenaceus]|uniref:glucan 1,3-beta-glucosidase n=1 Tax=Aspergillus avenaceus TaxID=36643 RepID=A0A5N6TYF6_ASPAV|nr:putative glucan 1,3-beta-glucosidase D [Aspergillus avenaceus]